MIYCPKKECVPISSKMLLLVTLPVPGSLQGELNLQNRVLQDGIRGKCCPQYRGYKMKWMLFSTFSPPAPYPLGKDFITERTASCSINKGSLSSLPLLLLAASICASDPSLSPLLVPRAARTACKQPSDLCHWCQGHSALTSPGLLGGLRRKNNPYSTTAK